MDVIEAGDVVEKPSPDIFRSSRQFLDSEVRLIEQIKRNFLDTVGCMEFRKFSRRHQGVFRDVARLWTLVLLVLCGFFSNLLFFSSCPNLSDIAVHGLFHKGYNLVILCMEIGMIVITSFWLLATQFQTGVVYSFRLSVLYTAITFLLFILRTTISDSHGSIFLQKCDYILSNGEVIVYNIIPLIYISLQFCISLVSFFYSKLRPIIAVYYFKHPWFLKSWKFVNIEPVELKLLSFGKKFDGCRNISPKSACSKSCCEASGSSEGMREGGDSGDARLFWKEESDNQNIRLASGYFIEIKRFSMRKLLKKLNPIRLDLLLTFRTRKDRARRPNSLKNQGCSVTSWYLGEINEEGRPHGFGRWREDDYYGEILVGFWKNGHPVGPFKTRECRSGSGFICLKLGFCRTEASPTPNLYGYADIECSVSGQFFRGFPLCHIYPAPATGIQRSGSIFARLGAKGKAALDDTTQKGKKMVGAVFSCSWIRGRKEDAAEKKSPTWKESASGCKKMVRLNIENTDETRENLESADFNNLSVDITSGGEQQNSKEEQTKLSGPCKSEINISFQKGVHMIRKVRQKLRRSQNRQEKERDISLLWVFQNLSPHIPMFTIHPKNEVTILVDAERGLYIAGYFPVSEVLRYTKQTGARLALSDGDPDCLLSENNLKSTILSPSDAAISGLIPFSSSFSASTIVKASQYPLNRSQDNRYLESVEVRVVDRYRHDSMYSKEEFDEEEAQDNTVYYPELEVKNWIHSDGLHAAEALIFIHGYNNTIVDALRQVGQMIAFGNFPSYIKPMVFSWPSGNSFLEYFKARKNAESPHTHNSLYQLILGLKNRGIRHIHVMTHSMGTRLFIQSFPKLLLENLLERCEQHDHRSSIDTGNYLGIRHSGTQLGDDITNPIVNEKVQIVSMTFLNPDYYLDDFINKAFPMLRQYCNLITMYGDSQDGALKWSEIIQGRKALGCNVFGLHYGVSGSFDKKTKSQINDLDQYRGSDVELTGGFQMGGVSVSNMDAYEDGINVSSSQRRGSASRASDENHLGSENAGGRQRTRNESALSLIYPSKVLINSFNASQSPRQYSPRASNSGILHTSSPYANKYSPEQRLNYLDMDVIDQSFIEQNVGTMRHNNWNLNREVIEDLRELVVSRKRAYQRSTRLDKREGNVWVYRIAPSCVTSIFD